MNGLQTSLLAFMFLLGRSIYRETLTLESRGSQSPNSSNFISGENSPAEINLFTSAVPPVKRQLLNHLRRTLWLFNPGSTGVPGAFLNLSHPVPWFPHRVFIHKVGPSRLAPLPRGRFLDKTRRAAPSAQRGQGGEASPRRLHLLCPGAPRLQPPLPAASAGLGCRPRPPHTRGVPSPLCSRRPAPRPARPLPSPRLPPWCGRRAVM